MTTRRDAIVKGLLQEMLREEAASVEADCALQEASIRFEVASQKYCAVRAMVTAHLGYSPYVERKQLESVGAGLIRSDDIGKLRFMNMKTGDAIVAALKETQKPMTLEEIVERLLDGRILVPKRMLPRAVNAALMRTTGIEKTEDGKYKYVEEEEEQF